MRPSSFEEMQRMLIFKYTLRFHKRVGLMQHCRLFVEKKNISVCTEWKQTFFTDKTVWSCDTLETCKGLPSVREMMYQQERLKRVNSVEYNRCKPQTAVFASPLNSVSNPGWIDHRWKCWSSASVQLRLFRFHQRWQSRWDERQRRKNQKEALQAVNIFTFFTTLEVGSDWF